MFVVNTLLVSRVLALLQGKSLSQTCGQWYLWSFPYYLVGAAVAGLMTATASRTDWLSALPILSLMTLVYVCYRSHLAQVVQ